MCSTCAVVLQCCVPLSMYVRWPLRTKPVEEAQTMRKFTSKPRSAAKLKTQTKTSLLQLLVSKKHPKIKRHECGGEINRRNHMNNKELDVH